MQTCIVHVVCTCGCTVMYMYVCMYIIIHVHICSRTCNHNHFFDRFVMQKEVKITPLLFKEVLLYKGFKKMKNLR